MSVNKVNKTTGDLSLLAGGTLYADNPIGSIIPYGGATAPAGWFICDGTELVRATYPELFAVIGTSFGTPSDNTKFKLPDLRGKFVEGVPISGSVGKNISAGLPNITGELGYLKALNVGNFFEGINLHEGAFSSSYNFTLDPIQNSAVTSGDGTSKSGLVLFRASDSNSIYGGSDTVQPPSVCVNYIIKAVSVGVPADFMSAVNVAVDDAIEGIGTIIRAEGNVHPTTADTEFIVCQATIPAGTWIVNCFSDLNYDGSTATYNNILRVTGATSKTVRTCCRNGGGSMVTSVISIDSPGVAYAMGYATSEMTGGADYKQRSLIEAIRIK